MLLMNASAYPFCSHFFQYLTNIRKMKKINKHLILYSISLLLIIFISIPGPANATETIPHTFMECSFGDDINVVKQKLKEKGSDPFSLKEAEIKDICIMSPEYNGIKFNYAVFSFFKDKLFSVRFSSVISNLDNVKNIYAGFSSMFDKLYFRGNDTNYPNLLIRTYPADNSVLQLTAESLSWDDKNTYQVSINYTDPSVVDELRKLKGTDF